jgi:hypothetical protein
MQEELFLLPIARLNSRFTISLIMLSLSLDGARQSTDKAILSSRTALAKIGVIAVMQRFLKATFKRKRELAEFYQNFGSLLLTVKEKTLNMLINDLFPDLL